MARRTGLIGRKLGMTRLFGESGTHIPVTVVDVGGNVVTAQRTQDNGHEAKCQRVVRNLVIDGEDEAVILATVTQALHSQHGSEDVNLSPAVGFGGGHAVNAKLGTLPPIFETEDEQPQRFKEVLSSTISVEQEVMLYE